MVAVTFIGTCFLGMTCVPLGAVTAVWGFVLDDGAGGWEQQAAHSSAGSTLVWFTRRVQVRKWVWLARTPPQY